MLNILVTIQVDRLKVEAVRKKRILKLCLMQESDISAKVLQMCFSAPSAFAQRRCLRRVQSKQLQPDYVNSYTYFTKSSSSSEINFVPTAFHKYVLIRIQGFEGSRVRVKITDTWDRLFI